MSLEAFGRIGRLLTNSGGKRYVADWLGDIGEHDWCRHHWGSGNSRGLDCKRRFDPHGVVCSLLP